MASLFGPAVQIAGVGFTNAGCFRLLIRLMIALLCLKHAYNERENLWLKRKQAIEPVRALECGQLYFVSIVLAKKVSHRREED